MDNQRVSPLMYAAKLGRVATPKVLLAENRSILNHKDRHGYTALHYAAENGHVEVVKLLVEAGLPISMPGPDRMTALHLASSRGNL